MSTNKILMIVDDEREDRFLFKDAVKQIGAGYTCLEAPGGAEALALLKDADPLPDLIFLDLNMPLMTGKECLTILKNDKRLKDIPVIIYSTSNYMADKESSRELGASYYLPKPWDIFKLPAEIIKAMEMIPGLQP